MPQQSHSTNSWSDGEAPGQATIWEQGAFDTCVADGEFKEAVRLLRAYDDLAITNDQAWRMLDAIPLDFSDETEALVALTYATLRKRNILRSFAAVPATLDALPLRTKEVDAKVVEEAIGLPMSALHPTRYGSEHAIGLQKLIQHEAGHFLLAYLLGCPVQGYFLSAENASAIGINGKAAVVFFDNDLSSGLKANTITLATIDRYTIVLMGGIAAEAVTYEQAEGGASDESALMNLLGACGWEQQRVFNQAMWAVTQAVLLIKKHQNAYDKLVVAMENGESLGACVQVIEGAGASAATGDR